MDKDTNDAITRNAADFITLGLSIFKIVLLASRPAGTLSTLTCYAGNQDGRNIAPMD